MDKDEEQELAFLESLLYSKQSDKVPCISYNQTITLCSKRQYNL